jgi:sodium-dependent dicarboxylate transporter 2/3/5
MPGATTFKWKQISDDISWDGIILIATGISLGLVMYSTGAAEWLSVILLGGIVGLHPTIQIFLIVMIVSIIKVGLSSNTVTATIIMPIMVVLAQSNNMPLLGILLPTALSLSLAFILVTSTPTSVIPYSAGYFNISDMAKAGAIMTVISSVIIALSVFGIGSLTGLY